MDKPHVSSASAPVAAKSDVEELTTAVRGLTRVLSRQNGWQQRLTSGLMFGVGTAIGASVIATLLIVGATRAMRALGFEVSIPTTATLSESMSEE